MSHVFSVHHFELCFPFGVNTQRYTLSKDDYRNQTQGPCIAAPGFDWLMNGGVTRFRFEVAPDVMAELNAPICIKQDGSLFIQLMGLNETNPHGLGEKLEAAGWVRKT